MNNHIQLVLKSSTAEISLNDPDAGIYLVPELDGLVGLPEIRTTSGVNAGYDGGWTSAQNFDARSITIRGVIANRDVAAVERIRKQLISLLAQGKSEQLTLSLVTEAGNAYELEVRTIACDMAMQTVLTQQQFMIQLRADDPLIYDGSASGESVLVQVQHAIGGFEINFELPLAISGGEGESIIENAGLEKVYPVISMYGALHNPTFVNVTTNQQIQVNATLGYAEGEWSTPSDIYGGKTITIDNAPDNAPLASFRLDGETSQNGTPTPSTPVAVNTTTGENVVYITGKNLFDISNNSVAIHSNAETTGSVIDGDTLRLTNLTAGSYRYYFVPLSDAKSVLGKTITLSLKASFVNATSSMICFMWASDTWYTSTLGNAVSFTTSGSYTCTVSVPDSIPSGSTRLCIGLYSSGSTSSPANSYIDFSDIQVELGSATDYEPYQGQSYEVNLGKNLLEFASTYTNLGITTTLNNDGTITISNTPTNNYANVIGMKTIDLPAGTYTLSRFNTNRNFTIRLYWADGTYNNYNLTSSSNTFTTTKQAVKFYMWIYGLTPGTAVNETMALQLEKGSATSFAAYFEPIELCKIGDYQDYIWNDNGTWKIHRAVGKHTFTGSETWNINTSLVGGYMITYSASASPFYGKLALGSPSYQSLCSNFRIQTNGSTWSGDGWGGFNASGVFWCEYLAKTTRADFLAWIADAGVAIYYPLDASAQTDETITNETLIAQLEAVLTTARTYAGINNIFTITPNEQGTIELTYMTEKSDDRRDVIVIDSRMRTITLNGTDAYHLLAEGSEFPLLAPGENKLLLRSDTPGDNGYAEVNYKQGYLSI